ncbi:MAG: hypothetical protein ACI4B9_01715 [Eggerthellaceae bacterium]
MLAFACAFLLVLLSPNDALAQAGTPAKSTDYGSRIAIDAGKLSPVTPDMIVDGEYTVAVRTDSSIFSIEKCVIKVQEGKIQATLTMAGHGYRCLYMGVGEDACVAGEDGYSEFSMNEDGKYEYVIQIDSLNTAIDVSALSNRNDLWYDHQLIFLASSLPGEALTKEGRLAAYESSPASQFADGVYTCTVTMTGGTGRASLSDPCTVTIRDGKATAKIEWSSQYYDYMIVDGKKIYPINDGGNSVFEFPIESFDSPIEVVGDTTALSQPYEIDYVLTFYSSSMMQKEGGKGPGWPVLACVVCLFAIGYAAACVAAKRVHRTARARRK